MEEIKPLISEYCDHFGYNKENVLANIHNIANAEYYTVYSTLSMYIVNDVKVCSALNKDWISAIEKDMVDIIYNPTLSNYLYYK